MPNKILLDTNILLYATDNSSPFYLKSLAIIEKALRKEITLCIADKSLYEYFSVLTSSVFSEKIPFENALEQVNFYLQENLFEKITSTSNTPYIVFDLMAKEGIKGKRIYDIVLVALALENDINTIYTKNTKDFIETKNLHIIDPT